MKTLAVALAFFLFVSVSPVWAQSADDAEVSAEVGAMTSQMSGKQQAMLDAPTGVFDVEYDNGALVRLKIKGEAEVPTSLKGVRADTSARNKATMNAKAAFSKFLEEKVVVVESNTESLVIKERDGTESAEYINTSVATITGMSQSFQRGLISLLDHVEGEGVDRKAVVVMGWSKKLTEASMQAQDIMKPAPKKTGSPSSTTNTTGKNAASGKTQTRMGDVDNF